MTGKKLSPVKHTPDILEKGRLQDKRSVMPKRERIGLISKAIQLGLIRKWKHPQGGYNVILQGEEDKTDQWEELEKFANNRRNMIVNLKLTKEMIDSAGKK